MREFRAIAQDAMDDPERRAAGLSFVYFNLANFRAFNETYGYSEGDVLLTETAGALADDFPEAVCSRFSSDRFAFFLSGVSLEELSDRLENLHERIHDFERAINIELKMGVYVLAPDIELAGNACDLAKLACDSVRHKYDVNLRVYDQELGSRFRMRQRILNTFDAALGEGRIQVFYQPVARAFTGQICGFEALARWIDPDVGFVSPADFVSVLEDSHLIHRLDTHIIRKVCEQWRLVSDRGGRVVPISVNLSRLDLQLADMFEVIETAVRENDMPRQMLHVEITESALTDDRDRLVSEVRRFREAGYQVWLDDFGSGYSSFSSLKDCEFDVAKIDMDFLREFDRKPKSRTILSSIVDLTKQLGMQTLTEGVESEEQRAFLRDIGCEMLQGYLIGRPQDFETTFALMSSGELQVEDYGERGYLDAIGHVNVLSPSPFALGSDGVANMTRQQLALAAIEREGGTLRYVAANRNYRDMLGRLGIGSLEESAARLNDPSRPQSHSIGSTISVARANRATETTNILLGERRCALRARFLSSAGGKESYLISLDSLTDASDMTEGEVRKFVSDYVCSLYDSVDLLDLEEGVLHNVLRSGSDARLDGVDPGSDDARLIFESFAAERVHASDRERFLRFAEMETLRERVSRTRGAVLEAVRVRRVSGDYVWKTLGFSTAESERYVIFWMRELDDDLMHTVVSGFAATSPASILAGIDTVSPLGFYWKDADQRYLGATAAFEELFGLRSPDDYVGRTDLEMGWLPRGPEYEEFERELLAAPPGECREYRCACVASGTLRGIVCREVAVVRSGRVEGIVGCVCDEASRASGATGAPPADDARIDEVTGLLDMRGFMVAEAAFEDAYAFDERDFAVVMVGIENLWETNAVFGPKHGTRVLARIAKRIREACGKNGVVARVAGTEFAILAQTDDRQAVEEMLDRVGDAISSITVVDGHACNPLYAMGYGFISEARDLESLMRLVSNRMRDGLAGRRLRNDDGIERMTQEDVIRRVQLLQPYFSTVRLVDPSCAQARLLEKDGKGFSEPSLCYGVWKAKHRCVNCISARTLATRSSQSKYEFRDDKVFFVNTQYVEVDGEPRVIEMVRALDLDIDDSSESGRHLRAAVTARDLGRYAYAEVPQDAGIFNRAYFDEMMAVLTSENMVVAEILAKGEDGSLRQPSANEMGAAATVLKSCVRPDDTVICYDAETLMVIFAQALPEAVLDGRLRVIRRRLELELRRETPGIDAAMTVVAVCRRDKASALAEEATRLLGSSRESGEEFVVARG